MTFKTWLPAFLIGSLATNVLFYFYRSCRCQILQKIIHCFTHVPSASTTSLKTSADKIPVSNVFFFPDSGYVCHHFVFSNGQHCGSKTCKFTHEQTSFFKLTQHIMKAQKTLDVCVYTLCHELLGDILIELHKQRGVLVRIITDDEALMQSNCQVGRLKSNGIAVRIDLTDTLMHHKFVIVDKKLLINGSFNWSFNAVTRNNENVLTTNLDDLVSPYRTEFEKLWELFDPEKIRKGHPK